MQNAQKELLHTPVLVSELLSLFPDTNSPLNILDCTFGRGGHSRALLKAFPKARVLALDRDKEAIDYGLSMPELKESQIQIMQANFHEFPSEAKEQYDLILMDLGVSSPQLDEGERGFGFYQDGPLDMRMDQSQKFKASDILNAWGKKDLIELFQKYGEIRNPHKVVSDILSQRKKKKFESTMEFSRLIQKFWPRRLKHKHPATQWFLALRIAVNQELEGLQSCLPDFLPLLKEQGCLAVISFHSLEDRIVKKHFRQFVDEGRGRLWNKKVIRPGLEERKQNPRSRSAKMRVFQKDH